MIASIVLLTLLLFGIPITGEPVVFTIRKCCPKGMQFKYEGKSCVKLPEMKPSHQRKEIIYAPLDENIYYWIPPKLRFESLTVLYGTLRGVDLDISDIQEYDEAGNNFREFYSKVNPAAIIAERNCYDTIGNVTRRRVEVRSIALRAIRKCCSKRGRLNYETMECEQDSDYSEEDDPDEEVSDISKDNSWLAGNLSHPIFKVIYDTTLEYRKFNYVIPEKTLQWKLVSTPANFGTVLRVYGKDIMGKEINNVTQEFCFDKTTEGLLGPKVLLVYIPEKLHIRKCCAKSKHYDLATMSCVPGNQKKEDMNSRENHLTNFNSTNDWIPPWMQDYPFTADYNTLQNYDIHDATVSTETFKFKTFYNYEGEPEDSLVILQQFCFENVINSNQSHVTIRGYVLRTIHKCCAKGEWLNSEMKACETFPGSVKQVDEDVEEVVKSSNNTKEYNWVPINTSKHPIKVNYNFFKEGYIFNIKALLNSDFSWKTKSSNTKNIEISFHGLDVSSSPVSGVTNIFCFDELANESVSPLKILLAVQYVARKCCPKGAQINNVDFACSPWPGQEIEGVKNGHIDWRNKPHDAYWLPTSLRNESISVLYSVFPNPYTPRGLISNESIWKLDYLENTTFPKLIINLTYINGKTLTIKTYKYCFDVLEDSTKVLLFQNDKYVRLSLPKCCNPGKIISPWGVCEKHNGPVWSPGISNYSSLFPPTLTRENSEVTLEYFCPYVSLATQSPHSERSLRYYQGDNRDAGKYDTTYFCNDYQRGADGGLEEVVGSCTFPEYSWSYEHLRPFATLMAAVLLLAAAVVAMIRLETRRTAHGRALTCHAVSLMTANFIQYASTFINPRTKTYDCAPIGYSAYFFMMASNWWLTAITFNMFLNFRKPLGALAPKAGDESKAIWQRFGIMSSVVWGATGCFTILAVTMHKNAVSNYENGIIFPSLAETRTCFEFLALSKAGTDNLTNNNLGAICFYYIPTAILTVINFAFIVVTSLKIRELRRGTSILRRGETSKRQGCLPNLQMQKVLFYAKLLLTTGILELIIEGVFWSSGRKSLSNTATLPNSKKLLFPIIASLLDAIRGVLVFWLSTGRDLKVLEYLRVLRGWFCVLWRWISGHMRTATQWATMRFHRTMEQNHVAQNEQGVRLDEDKRNEKQRGNCLNDELESKTVAGFDNLGMNTEDDKVAENTVNVSNETEGQVGGNNIEMTDNVGGKLQDNKVAECRDAGESSPENRELDEVEVVERNSAIDGDTPKTIDHKKGTPVERGAIMNSSEQCDSDWEVVAETLSSDGDIGKTLVSDSKISADMDAVKFSAKISQSQGETIEKNAEIDGDLQKTGDTHQEKEQLILEEEDQHCSTENKEHNIIPKNG